MCEAKPNKSAELLARYSDSILKKSNKVAEDTDSDKTLAEIVSFFLLLSLSSNLISSA